MENEAISGFVCGVMVLLVLLYLFLAVVSQKRLPSEHRHSCAIHFLRQKDQQLNNYLQLRKSFPQHILYVCVLIITMHVFVSSCVRDLAAPGGGGTLAAGISS